jgi:DNA-binding XRE family transcriptional regulator
MDALMKIDGDKVRVLRERKAWSQEHLATVSGLSVRTVQRVETEGSGLPETRLALAGALGVTAAELMGEQAPITVPGVKWGWIGWGAGVTAAHAGIFFGYLNGDSLPDTLRALGVVGAFAGISAGLIGVLNERFKRRQSTA